MTGATQQPSLLERARRAFPTSEAEAVGAAIERMPPADLVHADAEPAWVAGEQVWLPGRLYNPPIALDGAGVQDTILRCLYTRHHDGFVRQRAVEDLVNAVQPWIIPFVVRLAGEYVIEIVELIAARLDLSDPATRECYGGFVVKNPAFMALTRQRATSYWAAYYRWRFPVRQPKEDDRWETYPAFTLLDELAEAASAVESAHG